MRRIFVSILIVFFLVVLPLAVPHGQASAATVSPGEMISLVNNLRAGYGLPALAEDAILDSTAYTTAQTMAANGVCAHIGGARDRIAAAGFGGGATVFATENMACASSATISDIQGWWSDSVHMMPMTEARYTHIGAGAYTGSNGTTYYVLHAAYVYTGESGSGSVSGSAPAAPEAPAEAEEPAELQVEPVVTSTPQEDGSIVHIVQYGQALDTIATWYGVTIAEIKALNGMTSNTLYVGDALIIRLAPTVTITPTRTITPLQPTRTPSLTPTPTKVVIADTPTPTEEPGLVESLPKLDRQWLGFGLLIASAVGLMLVLYFLFIRSLRKK